MKLILILCFNLILIHEITAVFGLKYSSQSYDNQTVSLSKEKVKTSSVKETLPKNMNIIGFISSAIGKAKWNVLAYRMAKVFFTFILDLFLAQYFHTLPTIRAFMPFMFK